MVFYAELWGAYPKRRVGILYRGGSREASKTNLILIFLLLLLLQRQ